MPIGAIIKGIAGAFTQGKKNKAAKASQKQFNQDLSAVKNFQFDNAYANVKAGSINAPQLGDAQTGQLGTLGEAQGYGDQLTQAQVGNLGSAQGYTAEGYDAQNASLERAHEANLGEDTGFANQFENLQVNTAQAERQGQESDQALAAAQEASAHTGGGGATAIAQAALKAKQGVADSIGQQETQNAQLRAQGATTNQQAALQQRNLSRQNTQAASQFNAQAANQNSQFNTSAQNQAAQFGASANNAAAQFGASAANDFTKTQFSADNRASEFNAGAANSAAQFGASNANQFALQKFGAENTLSAQNAQIVNQRQGQQAGYDFNAQQANVNNDFQAQQLAAQGATAVQGQQYGQAQSIANVSAAQNTANQNAKQQGISDIVGGIAGAGQALFSDERLKENINLVGQSPSGLNIYTYNYIDSDIIYKGAIAQEVPEEARVVDPVTGYYKVYYNKIDINLEIVE